MKKNGQWLLLNYPLLWNTRAYILFPVILIINLLFFVLGYSSVHDLKSNYYLYFRIDVEYILVAVLGGVLTVIAWLTFYLRQNAFKSYLPLGKGHLIKEFFIILITITGISLWMFSFGQGKIVKLRKLAATTQLAEEANVINLAAHFLPFETDSFNPRYNNIANSGSEEIAIDTNAVKPADFSFATYNGGLVITLDSDEKKQLKNDFLITENANQLLRYHKKEEVRKVLDQYLRICDKYRVNYKLNTQKLSDQIFATPDFKLNGTTIGRSDYEAKEFVETYKLQNVFNTLDDAKSKNILSGDDLSAFIYWCITLSIILFSFRITKIKTWFIGIITFGLLVIINTMFVFIYNEGFFPFIILEAIVIFIIAINLISRKKKKLVSGICYLLSLWSLSSFITISYFLLKEFWLSGNYNRYSGGISYDNLILHYINFLFALLMIIFIMIPLAKKLQANPEE